MTLPTIKGKPTLATLKRLAAKVGATVDCAAADLSWSCYVDLPPGKVIGYAHGFYGSALASDKEGKIKTLAEAIEWIQQTIEDGCETDNPEECDHCNPEEETNP